RVLFRSDKEVARERRKSGDARKPVHKFRVPLGINIRVRDFEFGRAEQVLFHARLIEIRMIKPDGERSEKSVEIDQTAAGRFIIQVRAAAFFEIDYDLESVHQDLFLK